MCHPAVNRQAGARHVSGLSARQVGDEAGNLIRIADPLARADASQSRGPIGARGIVTFYRRKIAGPHCTARSPAKAAPRSFGVRSSPKAQCLPRKIDGLLKRGSCTVPG
jgi:hypothetical protein